MKFLVSIKAFSLSMFLLGVSVVASAQTANELPGRWELVGIKTAQGLESDIAVEFGTRNVAQVFYANKKFKGIVGSQSIDGTWKMSPDNKNIVITAGGQTVIFPIVYFDVRYRVVSHPTLGILSYYKR